MKPGIQIQLCHIQEKIFLGEELLPEEKELLSQFLQQEKVKQDIHAIAESMQTPLPADVDEIRPWDEFKALHELRFRVDKPAPVRHLPVSNIRSWLYRIVAAILLGVVLKLVIDQFNRQNGSANSTAHTKSAVSDYRITTATASIDSVRLPDGTTIWLDAGTTLSIPPSYASNRVVRITGKGYFDVQQDPQKPFMALLANGDTINVLGTRFNIESYPDSAITTLVSGKVELRTRGKVEELIPGEQAIHKGSDFSIRQVNTEDVLDWKSGYFSNNLKLSALLREFEKYYEVKIVYKDSITDFNVFTIGKLERSKGIDSLMNYLKMSRNLDYTKKGKTYEIRNYNK